MTQPEIKIIIRRLALFMIVPVLAACSSEDGAGMGDVPQSDNIAITFNSSIDKAEEQDNNLATRATSHNLEEYVNAFTVYGYKNQTDSETEGIQQVFPGYTVSWTTGTANTSLTNTNDWEYSNATQAVKFWDYATHHYNFVAVANANSPTITTDAQGRVSTVKMSVTSADNASEQTCLYYSRIAKIVKADYAKPVELRFVPYLSKIRIGFYEAIPGYTVKDFTFDGTSTTLTTHGKFAKESTCNLSYDYSQSKVTASSTPSTIETTHNFGALQYANGKLGETSTTATFALGGGAEKEYFLPVLPNETNDQALEITCSYTLVNTTTHVETPINNVKAIVPKEYTRWESRGEYSYVFKIIKVEEETKITLDIEAMTKWQSGYVHNTEW